MTFILPSNSQLHCITGASRCPRQNLGPGKVTPNWGSSNFCKLKTSKVALYQTVPMMVYVDRSGCVVGVRRKTRPAHIFRCRLVPLPSFAPGRALARCLSRRSQWGFPMLAHVAPPGVVWLLGLLAKKQMQRTWIYSQKVFDIML